MRHQCFGCVSPGHRLLFPVERFGYPRNVSPSSQDRHIATLTEPLVDARPRPAPFVKWAGGKRQMLGALEPRAPRDIGTYFEPFIGGGAMLFAMLGSAGPPERAVVNDLNAELMTAYEVVRDRLDGLMVRLRELEQAYLDRDDEARAVYFYAVREDQPQDELEVAARLVFLNRTCFNGLYRVNRQGRFNVPHGRYRNPRILDEPGLRAASEALQATEFTAVDFEAACEPAAEGDFVYLDPPFYPLSKTSSFTEYTKGEFAKDEQLRLRWLIDALTERGVRVMLSNSPADWIVGVYEGGGYEIDYVPARRAINARGDGRGPIDELIVTNYAPETARGPLEAPAAS
jgi:DNA adenine methylase